MKRVISLAILAVLFFSCSAAKRNRHKHTSATVEHQRKNFYMDSIASIVEFGPEKGFTMVIENVQIYVVTKSQPATGVTVKQANGEEMHHILPQLSNSESFSYGGGVHYVLHDGDKARIDIYDAANNKPIKSRIIVSGYEEN